MMYIHMTFSKKNHSTSLHSTYLFKIFFSLLTLSTAFLQNASGPGKNSNYIIFDLALHCPIVSLFNLKKLQTET